MNKQLTVIEFFKLFPDDNTCLEHIFESRYGQDYTCPKCGKQAKWYRLKSERAYSCGNCGHHLHPTVGTPFESSRTSLQLWFYAIYLFTTTRHGVSGKELQRTLGVTYKTAWRMGHEIRKHMSFVDGDEILEGEVEIDETYIGGVKKGTRGRGAKNKTILFGMVERNGDVMTMVVPDVKRNTLQPEIEENVCKTATVYTDELRTYNNLDTIGYRHRQVQHGTGEYVRGKVHTNTLEGYWSNLKSSIKSTHMHVSSKHLEKYAKEFEYRFNSRENPEGMFAELISTFQ